jgi:hypothetical protein
MDRVERNNRIARSPDLSPLDFFLAGLCEKRSFNKPLNIGELEKIANISYKILIRSLQILIHRIHYSQEDNGEHFEHPL